MINYELTNDIRRIDDGGVSTPRLGPRQDRRLLLTSTAGDRRAQTWWHPRFEPVACDSVADFDVVMGHEIARAIRQARATTIDRSR